MRCLTCLLVVTGSLAWAASAPAHSPTPRGSDVATQAGRYCSPIRKDVVVIRIKRTLGCSSTVRRAIARTVRRGDYRTRYFYGRWGQGGTRPIRVEGKIYYGGFVGRLPSYRETSFLGRRTG